MEDSIPGYCITATANAGLVKIYWIVTCEKFGCSRPVSSLGRVAWLLRLAPVLPGLVYCRLPGRYCAGTEPHQTGVMGQGSPKHTLQRWEPRQKFKGKGKLYGRVSWKVTEKPCS